MAEQEKEPFNFNISLSVLDHLGRNLYRNFITVLGEAISNSWDAGATKVEIMIYDGKGSFSIKDDGVGMNDADFRNKFLEIGYSRREDDNAPTPKGRPLIGGKGIGKLALLSCAKKIHIRSKKIDSTDYTGVLIDNDKLDEQIGKNSAAVDCKLEEPNTQFFEELEKGHKHGTIIYFENVNKGVNSKETPTLRKLIALYFRFSLVDSSFSIVLNGTPVDLKDLKELSNNTQFVWTINEFNDPFIETLTNKKEQENRTACKKHIKGFIASVEKPTHLKIFGAREKIGIDIFVNGRLRETNIIKNTPDFAARHIAQYLYGQIHLDILDDANSENNEDRFTTSREGIIPEDRLYKNLLKVIEKKLLNKISKQWDDWRRFHKQDGDPDGTGIPIYKRWLEQSKNARVKDFEEKIDSLGLDSETTLGLKEKLQEPSQKNTEIYQDLFMLENLFREFLKLRGISNESDLKAKFLNDGQVKKIIGSISHFRRKRAQRQSGHVLTLQGKKIEACKHDLGYLDLEPLGNLVDKVNKNNSPAIKSRAVIITPVRDVVMHTNEVSQDVMDWDEIKNVIDIMDALAKKP